VQRIQELRLQLLAADAEVDRRRLALTHAEDYAKAIEDALRTAMGKLEARQTAARWDA
jgi:hypothetical protein